MGTTTENVDIKIDIQGDAGIKSVRSMQLETRALRQELIDLENEANKAFAMGDDATVAKAKARHAERTAQLEQLKFDTKDLAAANKYLDPGELIGGYAKLAQGAVGAFGAVTAGMKLAGIENESLNETMAQAGLIIEFLTAIESARALIIDQGARAENASLIKNTALWIKKTAVEGYALVMAQAQAVATGEVTVAQGLLNVVMSLNPIGLVVLAVAGLIAGFYALYKATGSLTEAFLWMVNPVGMLVGLLYENYEASKIDNTEKEKSIAIAKEKVKATEKEIDNEKKILVAMEKNHETMKARGATEKELFADSLRMSEQRIKIADKEMQKATEQFDLSKQQGELSLVDFIRIENAKKGVREATEDDAKLKEEDTNRRIAEAKAKAKSDYEQKLTDEATYQRKMEDLKVDAIKNEFERNEAKITIVAQREIEALNKNAKNYDALVQKILDKQDADLNANDEERKKSRETAEKEIEDAVYAIMLESLNLQLEGIKDAEEKKKKIKEISAIEEATAIDNYEKANQKLKTSNLAAYEQGLANIKTKFANDRTAAVKTVDDAEIAKEKDKADKIKEIQDKINGLKQLSFKEQIEEIRSASIKEIAEEEKKFKALGATTQQYLDWKELKEKDTAKKIAEAKQKQFEDEVNKTTETVNQVNDLFNQASEQKLERLDIEYSDKQEKLQSSLDNGLITQEQFDKQSEKLEIEKNNKIRAEKEKAWKRQHAVDIANAVANAAIAVAQVFAQEPGELITKTIAAGIAATIAAGQVALIASQPMPKFARGGFVGGGLHSQGGTMIEAERGEFVVNRQAMANPSYASLVQNINNIGLGLSAPKPFGQPNQQTSYVDTDAIANAVIAAVSHIPVILSESDVTTSQRRVAMIESNASIG